MLALIGYGLLGIVVAIGVVALLVLVLPSDHLGAAPRDVVPAGLPSRPDIDGEDVARVRLPVTLRGYRMVDTDAVLDRLALELERRDHEIDDLRRSVGLPARAIAARTFGPGAVDTGAAGEDDEVLARTVDGYGADGYGADGYGADRYGADPYGADDSSRPYASAEDAPSHPIAGDPHHDAAVDRAGPPR